MILIKNTANQVVYSKLINTSTNVPVSGEASGSLTAYISKDGGAEGTVSNSISSVGHGIYKLTLTQAETNCDSGIINFTHTSNSQYQFETIYFQTTEANPNVSVVQNNDKTGYFLDNTQTFSTSGSVGSVSDATSINSLIKSSTYDGVAQEKLFEMILAFVSGKVVITTVDANTRLISYKKRDGSTEIFNITASTVDGARANSGNII